MAFDVNEFFQSVDIILTQRLADLSYDKTVIATIIDDSEKKQGHYIVSDGTVKFDAYSNDLSYRVDDQVRITILNGDWSQKKFIAGKYSDNELTNSAVTYIPPLGTTMQNNHSTLSKNNNWTLYTNNITKRKAVWEMKITPDSDYYTLQANGIYNVITLSGDFQTNLGLVKQGNYGLLLELFISPDPNSNTRIRKFITFDSSEMVGNPYSFVIDSRQSKQILIASEGIVTEVILSIYQGQNFDVQNNTLVEIDNLFMDYDNNKISELPIHFKNIEIGFGSDLTKVEDNSLQIYTTSSATYHYNEGAGDETNNKLMGLIWYNKSEDDEYIGFSDGVINLDKNNQIIQYDEIDYLEKNYAEARLIAQKGKSGIPTDELSLTLAANIEESEPFMTRTYESLTTDLSVVLQSMGRQLGGTELQKELNKLISSYKDENGNNQKALLVQYQDIAKQAVQDLVIFYKSVLLYGYNIQNEITMDENEKWQNSWDNVSYYSTFSQAINNAFSKVEEFIILANNLTKNNAELAGYRGIYDSYTPKIKKAISAIKINLDQVIYQTTFNKSLKTDEAWLKTYKSKTKTSFIPYAEVDLSDYDNKYCIYWYRYNELYDLNYITPLSEKEWNNSKTSHSSYDEYLEYCENNNREYQFARFLGNNWERVLVDSDNNIIQNFGLPTTVGETINNVTYFPASPIETKILNRRMVPTTPEERYQAILFYNHNMVKSNVLTFTNTEADQIPNEFKVDANDTLIIEHGAYSQDHYQSYTSAFDLVNIADESKSRGLRVSYDGVKVGDEALAGASIYWYIPVNATMLTYDRDYLVNNLGFSTDAGPLQLTLTGNADSVTYTFSETLPDTTQLVGAMIGTKTIIAQDLVKNTITLDKTLSSSSISNQKKTIEGASTKTAFSKNGYVYFYKEIGYVSEEIDAVDIDGNIIYKSDGTAAKDTKISIIENDRHFAYKIKPFYEPSAQNNSILVEAHVHGQNGQTKITTGEIFFTFSTFGSNGTKYTLTITPATNQIAVLPTSSLSLNLGLRNANNELIELNDSSVGSLNDEPNKINTYQLRVNWHAQINGTPGGLALSDIEGSAIKNIDVANTTDDNKYTGIIAAKVSYLTEGKNAGEQRVITLNTLYSVPFSASENYYISGPTTIVYNNQGVVSRLSEEPFKLYSRYIDSGNKDENGNIIFNENVEVPNQSWRILYYDNKGKQVFDNSEKILNYMPSLNGDNTLMPAPMYYHYKDNETFYVPVVQCIVNKSIVWTQPIIITQNQYASSTLNDWNGHFEINEENGTILSTMLGAGRKTENNTFEGVLIGDIEAGANFDTYNADGLGIYGFNDGAQSFYFGVNGKAFLGKSNSGRIIFDGNDGLIYSGNWLSSFEKNADGTYKVNPFKTLGSGNRGLNPGKAGLAIDLQEGHIDAYNFKVTSNNIYLNSNPPDDGYYFRIGNNGGKTPIDDALSDNDDNGVPRMTRGYMALTKDGSLDIRTNSLSITGQLGGVNLLKQTEPKRIIPLQEHHPKTDEIVPATDNNGNHLFDWSINKKFTYNEYENYCRNEIGFVPFGEEKWMTFPEAAWISNSKLAGSYPNSNFTEINSHNHKKNYLAITGGDHKVSQVISEIKKGENYTVSGYVSGITNSGTLTISFDNKDIVIPQWSEGHDTIEYSKTKWTRFEHTIKVDSDNTELTITFAGTNDFCLWHTKFENGAISSVWSPAPSDTEDTIIGEQEKYDIYLSQDKIFEKLITDANGEKMVGIWLLPGEDTASSHSELYINASYISTGILRSTNWNGSIGKKATNKKDKYGNTIYTYEITKDPTQGLYLNLDEGKLWAAKFELDAKSGGSGLYLNSHPSSNEDWFFIGNSNSYLQFSGASDFTLQVTNNFTLKTSSIYLSDVAKSYSVTLADKTTKNANLVLRIGDKFSVSSDGILYATGAEFTGNINSESGTIGGWSIGKTALSAINGTVVLNSSKGSVEGATIKGGIIEGTNIFAKTLDIGGYDKGNPVPNTGNFRVYEDGTLNIGNGSFKVDPKGNLNIGNGNFKIDSNGNLVIKDSEIFQVTNDGKLTATSATIGGWQVKETEISNNGISLKSDADKNPGVYSANWKSLQNGATEFKNLIVSETFNVLKSGTFDPNSSTIPNPDKNNTVFGVKNNGNINFTGTITLGPLQKEGIGSTADTGKPPSDGNGYVTIKVDTPWENGTSYMTFYNGVLCGYHYEKGSLDDFFEWLLGDERSEKGIGSETRPVYVAKGGKVTPIKRVTSGQLYMGRGTLNDPAFIDVTGYSHTSYPNRFGLTYSGHGDASSTTANRFYVTVPSFTGGTTSEAGKPGLVPAPAQKDNTDKFLRGTGSWQTLYAPTSKGTKGYVWMSTGGTSSDTNKPGWYSLTGFTTDATKRKYKISRNTSSDAAVNAFYVEINAADSAKYGVVKTGYTTSVTNRNYAVKISSDGNLYVNVPWKQYTAGNGVSINSSNEIKCTLTSVTSATRADYADYADSAGYAESAGYAYSVSSRRFKHDIGKYKLDTDILYKLEPTSFIFNEDMRQGSEIRYGFIAEDVFEFAPQLVAKDLENPDLCYAIHYNSILTLAVAEIQKLRKELDELKSKINKE